MTQSYLIANDAQLIHTAVGILHGRHRPDHMDLLLEACLIAIIMNSSNNNNSSSRALIGETFILRMAKVNQGLWDSTITISSNSNPTLLEAPLTDHGQQRHPQGTIPPQQLTRYTIRRRDRLYNQSDTRPQVQYLPH
ncbi:hypothetical protein BGZ58_009883 [Dissophora ornata]|nr:hypothetical protein BGZ58_009883 [Dissophora ornata]